jgi:hypothetical protein
VFVSHAKTQQNAKPALLASSQPMYKNQRCLINSFAPALLCRGIQGVFMICHQVIVNFSFSVHKAVLVSISTKEQEVKDFLVLSGLPFGKGLKYCRFFETEQEAENYVSYLNTVYKDRIVPSPAHKDGQLYLF